jgi:putative hydrolase of the HAD superfamily
LGRFERPAPYPAFQAESVTARYVTVPSVEPPTHVLFDFFGTLVEYSASRTAQGYAQAYDLLTQSGSKLSYEQFLSLWELTFLEFERSSEVSLVEFSMDDVCTEFLRRAIASPTRFALIRQFRDTYLNEWNQGVTYVSGVPLLLAELRQRYNLVLITNTHHAALVRNHLDQMNVSQYFSTVVTSVDFGKKKPSPEIFAHALELSEGTAKTSVYVGDSFVADYQGAHKAGMRCLLIDPTERFEIRQSARIGSVLELRKHLL